MGKIWRVDDRPIKKGILLSRGGINSPRGVLSIKHTNTTVCC
jgi:hypothetical protein